MLRHLHITNFAILSDVALDLEPGFVVFTGETGAGKSLIVDAVSLLRGGRARSDIPRAGCSEAVVEAVFEPPPDLAPLLGERLEAAGLPLERELVVRRVIARAGGRSRIHVNGALTTAAVLAELGALLVDLSGQHEHQGLCDPSRHGHILDAFGVAPDTRSAMAGAYQRLRAAHAALAALDLDDRQREQRVDFLRFQLQELAGVDPRPGEDQELEAERRRLSAARNLAQAASRSEEILYASEGAASGRLAAVVRELEPFLTLDDRLAGPARQVEEARVLVEDAARALGQYASSVSDDPARLVEIEDRLDLVRRLLRKHGGTIEEVLATREAMTAELASLESHESRKRDLGKELEVAQAVAREAARALTEARRKVGGRLEAAVSEALVELGMKGARLLVTVTVTAEHPQVENDGESGRGAGGAGVAKEPSGVPAAWSGLVTLDGQRLGPRGQDHVELLLQANRGEEPRPLHKIASGGELSRIMLAIKLCLKHADEVATYVFDEVDAGIGGSTAEIVGRQIQRVSSARQVLCVTHHPQIAALATSHFRVEKYEEKGRTETRVVRLEGPGRRDEVARMLGGLTITAKTRAHADEMLAHSRARKATTRSAREAPARG